jgi:histone H3/H4
MRHAAAHDLRRIMEGLIQKSAERKDDFATAIRKAIEAKLGDDAEEALKSMTKNGINRNVAKKALAHAEQQGRFTIWSLVDALTRLAGETVNAGDRTEADQTAAGLLELVA